MAEIEAAIIAGCAVDIFYVAGDVVEISKPRIRLTRSNSRRDSWFWHGKFHNECDVFCTVVWVKWRDRDICITSIRQGRPEYLLGVSL